MNTEQQKFLSRLSVTDGCWIWKTRSISPEARGTFRVNGKHEHAARAAYLLFVGEIPHGMYVCHRCDVGLCCNPEHLWLGTQKENMADCAKKGRIKKHRIGITPPNARLTVYSVREIRNLHASGEKQIDLAARYGVTVQAINHVVLRKNWKSA